MRALHIVYSMLALVAITNNQGSVWEQSIPALIIICARCIKNLLKKNLNKLFMTFLDYTDLDKFIALNSG